MSKAGHYWDHHLGNSESYGPLLVYIILPHLIFKGAKMRPEFWEPPTFHESNSRMLLCQTVEIVAQTRGRLFGVSIILEMNLLMFFFQGTPVKTKNSILLVVIGCTWFENNARADFSPASRELADSVAQRGFDSAYHGLFAGAPKSSYLLVFLDTARVSNI